MCPIESGVFGSVRVPDISGTLPRSALYILGDDGQGEGRARFVALYAAGASRPSIVLTSNTYGHVLEQRQRAVARGMDAVLQLPPG